MNRAPFQYLDIPVVGILPVPPNNKSKFKVYDSEDHTQCGYSAGN